MKKGLNKKKSSDIKTTDINKEINFLKATIETLQINNKNQQDVLITQEELIEELKRSNSDYWKQIDNFINNQGLRPKNDPGTQRYIESLKRMYDNMYGRYLNATNEIAKLWDEKYMLQQKLKRNKIKPERLELYKQIIDKIAIAKVKGKRTNVHAICNAVNTNPIYDLRSAFDEWKRNNKGDYNNLLEQAISKYKNKIQ